MGEDEVPEYPPKEEYELTEDVFSNLKRGSKRWIPLVGRVHLRKTQYKNVKVSAKLRREVEDLQKFVNSFEWEEGDKSTARGVNGYLCLSEYNDEMEAFLVFRLNEDYWKKRMEQKKKRKKEEGDWK